MDNPATAYARGLANADIAQALDFIGSSMRGGISDAIMKEAARRLRGEPEPHYAVPPFPHIPPLKAYAEAEP